MDYPGRVRKSARLHIQPGRHGIICIWKIEVNAPQSSNFSKTKRLKTKTIWVKVDMIYIHTVL